MKIQEHMLWIYPSIFLGLTTNIKKLNIFLKKIIQNLTSYFYYLNSQQQYVT